VRPLNIVDMEERDVEAVVQLIELSFGEAVAPTFSDEGVNRFMSGVSVHAIEQRLKAGSLFVVCRDNDLIRGMGEIRNGNHLNLLFVHPEEKNKGIGRRLFANLLERAQCQMVTVNASLNAIAAYRALGFIDRSQDQEKQGIKFRPMLYTCRN